MFLKDAQTLGVGSGYQRVWGSSLGDSKVEPGLIQQVGLRMIRASCVADLVFFGGWVEVCLGFFPIWLMRMEMLVPLSSQTCSKILREKS